MSDEKLDKIHDEITDIKIVLVRNTTILEQQQKSLEHHIKRTDTLEALVKKEAILPIQVVKGTAALVGVLGSIYSVYKLFF